MKGFELLAGDTAASAETVEFVEVTDLAVLVLLVLSKHPWQG